MSKQTRGVVRWEHYLYFAEPALPGKRAAAREVLLGSWESYSQFVAAQDAYYTRLKATGGEWPEGHATVEVFASGRRQRTGVTFYFHGPLGWMDPAYVRGSYRHDLTCEKCNALFPLLDSLYPGLAARDAVKRLGPKRWEAMEAMVADKAHWRYRHGS